MTKAKDKSQYFLPDPQLARAFRFSPADLASNRAGFVTDAQRWNFPMIIRFLGWVGEDLSYSSNNRPIATRIGGKIKIGLLDTYKQRYKLYVEGHEATFMLSAKQANMLEHGQTYYIYYDSRNGKLLSLEKSPITIK